MIRWSFLGLHSSQGQSILHWHCQGHHFTSAVHSSVVVSQWVQYFQPPNRFSFILQLNFNRLFHFKPNFFRCCTGSCSLHNYSYKITIKYYSMYQVTNFHPHKINHSTLKTPKSWKSIIRALSHFIDCTTVQQPHWSHPSSHSFVPTKLLVCGTECPVWKLCFGIYTLSPVDTVRSSSTLALVKACNQTVSHSVEHCCTEV